CTLVLTYPVCTAMYRLSLHDALPISRADPADDDRDGEGQKEQRKQELSRATRCSHRGEERPHRGDPEIGERDPGDQVAVDVSERSEEHTSELQSPCNLVCRLLLEKKK